MAENEVDKEPDQLPAELADYVDEEVPQGWTVSSISSADWALARIADCEREIQEHEEVLRETIARERLKTDALIAKSKRGVAFFTWQLKRWANASKPLLLKGSSKKSRALLHGTIGWRAQGGGLEVVDKDALLAWAQQQPVEFGLVRISEEPAIKAIKQWVMDGDGDPAQFPPGLKVSQAQDEFYIRAQSHAPKEEQHDDAAE